MKIKLLYVFIIAIIIQLPIYADEVDCSQFKKLSTKYIECNTNKKIKIGKEKFEKSGIKDKLEKLKGSKTLTDLIKN